MKKKIIWSIFILILLWVLVDFIHKDQVSKDLIDIKQPTKIILNNRQKNILKKYKLSTNYDQLPSHQQRAIIMIDEMLSYVENKYHMNFCYTGYSPASFMEKEHIRAYPATGYPSIDSFTIIKTKKGYEDNFLTVAVRPYLVSYIHKNIQEILPNTHIKVYSEIIETSLKKIPDEKTNLDGKVAGTLWIFIDSETCNSETFYQFCEQVQSFLIHHNLKMMMRVVLIKPGYMDRITDFNFVDYLSPDYYELSKSIPFHQ